MQTGKEEDIFNLKGRVAVVTGGSGQLGRQFCAALAAHGSRVAVFDKNILPREQYPELVTAIKGDRIKFFTLDITVRKEIERALDELKMTWSPPDILVNAAAIDSPPSAPPEENGPFETYPEASLDRIMAVNIKGLFLCCQVIGGEMARRGRGSIINISSIYGLVSPNQDIYAYKRKNGAQWYKPAAYALTKSALLNLTRYLATYWAQKGVRVNTISPAGIFNNQDSEFLDEYTKRVPLARMAEKHEINGAIIFLASKASSYVTGANLVVDGGFTSW